MTWNRWSHSSIYNKNDANNIFSGWYKIGFEIKNEIEGQCQSGPKFSGILRVLRCICGPNLEILSWIGGEWWYGQAQNMVIFHFEVKFDLEVQGQLPPKTIRILTKVFCSSGPNLVILAWTCDKLSRGQASDYRTHRRTHRQTQATTIPEGQNWPRVKTSKLRVISLCTGNSPVTGEFPEKKWPVTRKMFPFDDAIMPRHNVNNVTDCLAALLSANRKPGTKNSDNLSPNEVISYCPLQGNHLNFDRISLWYTMALLKQINIC